MSMDVCRRIHATTSRVAACVVAVLVALSILAGPRNATGQVGPEHGVYLQLVEGASVDFETAVASVRAAAEREGLQLVADFEVGVDRDACDYRAHVLAVTSDQYSRSVASRGHIAAFALPLRIAVFEDERGVNIAASNPLSMNRTIVAETGFETQSQDAVGLLRALVADDFAGSLADGEYGQMREKGLIEKTMGLIAGGAFDGKVEEIASVDVDGADGLTEIADRLYEGLEDLAGERRWETRPVYRLDLPEHGLVIIGVTGAAMEAKAFDIVGEGNDEAREDFACPGLAHAAAFPVELVLSLEEDEVVVYMIDEMFRMKMYFEDAGTMKFAANMRMPPSIENEIRDKVEDSIY